MLLVTRALRGRKSSRPVGSSCRRILLSARDLGVVGYLSVTWCRSSVWATGEYHSFCFDSTKTSLQWWRNSYICVGCLFSCMSLPWQLRRNGPSVITFASDLVAVIAKLEKNDVDEVTQVLQGVAEREFKPRRHAFIT